MPSHRAAYPDLIGATRTEAERIKLAAGWILGDFERFYEEFQQLTWLAKTAFEFRDHPAAVAHAKRRLGLYYTTVYSLGDELRLAYPALAENEALWDAVEAAYRPTIDTRYDADLALAYLHSAMRQVHRGEWRPVEYAFGEQRSRVAPSAAVYDTFECHWPVEPRRLLPALQAAELRVPFRDLESDAASPARDSMQSKWFAPGSSATGVRIWSADWC
jgi:isocitrate dehydrogenase kinase/phosphatase